MSVHGTPLSVAAARASLQQHHCISMICQWYISNRLITRYQPCIYPLSGLVHTLYRHSLIRAISGDCISVILNSL